MLRKRYRLVNVWAALLAAVLTDSINAQTAKPTPQATPPPRKEVHRWLDIETLSILSRYRFIETANGSTAANQQQWQINARARFKFDRKGKYSVVFGAETGPAFTAGWDNLGWGTGDLQTTIFPKHLYFDAKPVKAIEIQFGGIGINMGENTEVTAYDNDAYLTGERIQIRIPKSLYFDEISFSNGYVGDVLQPSVFHRFKHLDKSNYHQVLVRKKVNKRVSFSADYTFEAGADTLRQAVKVNTPEIKIADSLLYENYERIDPQAGYGFALSGEKHVNQKLTLTGGFAKISHVMLNGDRFPRGERFYFGTIYKLTREFSIAPVIIQAVGPLPTSLTPRTRFEFIASYNILEAFHHYHVF